MWLSYRIRLKFCLNWRKVGWIKIFKWCDDDDDDNDDQ